MAFYDALSANESAAQVLGDQQLAFIAHQLLNSVPVTCQSDLSKHSADSLLTAANSGTGQGDYL